MTAPIRRTTSPRLFGLALGLVTASLIGCNATDAPPPIRDLGQPFDLRQDSPPQPKPDGPPPPPADKGIPADLPSQHLERCVDGKCAGGLVCIEELCRKPCTPKDAKCNDKASACAATEACWEVTKGSGKYACVSAKQPGATCSGGEICEGGTLCVNAFGAQICRKLCAYGCSASEKCGKSTAGCDVCLPKS